MDINHESFLLTQPDTLEDGANLAVELIATGRIRLVIWDSVASMMPSAKAEAEIGKSLPAVQAKLLSDLGQKLNPLLYQHQTLNIFVNHLKEVLSMNRPAHLGPKMGTPGGVALKFYASVRVEYKQIGQIKEKILDPLSGQEVEITGAINVEVKVTKNKVAPPFRKAVVRVRFGRGFDNFWTSLQILLSAKKVMYSSGYYYFHRVEDEGLVPEWMERAKTGTKRPYIYTDARIFRAADDYPEWREDFIRVAEKALAEGILSVASKTPEEVETEAEKEAEVDAIVPKSTDGNRMSFGG